MNLLFTKAAMLKITAVAAHNNNIIMDPKQNVSILSTLYFTPTNIKNLTCLLFSHSE